MSNVNTETDRAAEARKKHADYLLPAVANYYAEPLVLESGNGHYVKDADGTDYLDFFGGILTVSIGHCDPRVTEPIKAQVDRLGHVSSLYPVVPVVELDGRDSSGDRVPQIVARGFAADAGPPEEAWMIEARKCVARSLAQATPEMQSRRAFMG